MKNRKRYRRNLFTLLFIGVAALIVLIINFISL
ncbi:hypothetical protein SAMN05880501_1023 [Ureibacillus xyleni]|uniref:Uncharacterized protein n=1 Tax=Ureibacillus xyleni TaxID=614648 RepID=A0A285RV80_9BACL|nr:hypothetical protein SAMN05880501_1023 [Ureibacillus xyleni]